MDIFLDIEGERLTCAPREAHVYIYEFPNGESYVGKCENPKSRDYSHRRSGPLENLLATYPSTEMKILWSGEDQVSSAEKAAIEHLVPSLNTINNPHKSSRSKRKQTPREWAGEYMLRRMRETRTEVLVEAEEELLEKEACDLTDRDIRLLAPDGDLMTALAHYYYRLVDPEHRTGALQYGFRHEDLTETYLKVNKDNPHAPTFSVVCRGRNCATEILGYAARPVDAISGMVAADLDGLRQSGIPKPKAERLESYLKEIEKTAETAGSYGGMDYEFIRRCNDLTLKTNFYFVFLRAFFPDFKEPKDDTHGAYLCDFSRTTKNAARDKMAWLMSKHYHNDHGINMDRGYSTERKTDWDDSLTEEIVREHITEISRSAVSRKTV